MSSLSLPASTPRAAAPAPVNARQRLRRAATRLLFTADAKQALRLRRFLMAAASYGMWLAGVYYGTWLGVTDLTFATLNPTALLVVLTNVVLFALLRSGLNLRLKDPSLTMLQIIVAICWALVMIEHTHQARGLAVMVYFIIFFFGVFKLSLRQFLLLSAFGLSGYASVLLAEHWRHPEASMAFEWLRFVVLGFLLMWLSSIGSYVAHLRRKLAIQNGELEAALARIHELAVRDELTQLYNRRHLMETLEVERARAETDGSPLAVCLIDLDFFKAINDRYGHSAGDQILRDLTACIGAHIRSIDARGTMARMENFGRYGGEEFLLVLPMTSLEGAWVCAERLRAAVAAEEFHIGNQLLKITLSAGVAEFAGHESVTGLLNRADWALYQAKAEGRNRVHIARDQSAFGIAEPRMN